MEIHMQDILQSRFLYDPSNKSLPLIYRSKFRKSEKHSVAGFMPKSDREYCKIKILSKSELLNRVVWIYFNGEIPDGYVIDHINGDKYDNRIGNLQAITNEKNKRYGTSLKYKNNKSGMTGVLIDSASGKWKVSFRHKNKLYYFGLYDDLEEAKRVCVIERNNIYPESRRNKAL